MDILMVLMMASFLRLLFGDLLGYTDGKVLDTKIRKIDRITLGLHVKTDLGSLDAYFDSYNNV